MASSKESISLASDGKPAIPSGIWALDKLHYLKNYCEIFSTGMKNLWEHRIYIDLFSGPGICVIEDTGGEQLGSPLISLGCKTPFTHYYFIDKNKDYIEALRYRSQDYQLNKAFLNMDCNHAIDELLSRFPKTDAIFFTFIDPFSFEIEFNSIRKLTDHRPMDLLITFHIGNLKRSIHHPSDRMRKFFPPLDWKELYRVSYISGKIHERLLLDKYEEGLKEIDYAYFDDCILTRNIQNAPLYYLLFATKNKKGKEFYSKISMRSRTGQGRFQL
jgi:three-Cys-motif partner protein